MLIGIIFCVRRMLVLFISLSVGLLNSVVHTGFRLDYVDCRMYIFREFNEAK